MRYCNNCEYSFATKHTCTNKKSEYYGLTMRQIEEKKGRGKAFCVLFKKKRRW